jgi:hypothetical protein
MRVMLLVVEEWVMLDDQERETEWALAEAEAWELFRRQTCG